MASKPLLVRLNSTELYWGLDFSPAKTWPSFLPIVAFNQGGQLKAATGFERKSLGELWVLEVQGDTKEIFDSLYPPGTLGSLEMLRFNSALGVGVLSLEYLMNLPIELQNFFDQRQVSLKSLKPLEHLTEWVSSLSETFLELKPSSSQVREILDFLCDLKFLDLTWAHCAPSKNTDVHQWLIHLNKMRNPRTNISDETSQHLVEKAPWPRGVRAKWERQGDQGAIHIQARVSNLREFENLKKSLSQVQVEEKLWNL